MGHIQLYARILCQNDSTKNISLGNFYYYLHEITKKNLPPYLPAH